MSWPRSRRAMERELDAEALSHGWSLSFDELALVEAMDPTARRDFETDLLERVAASLAPGTVSYMEASLASSGSDGFDGLKADPGPVSLESVLTTAESLAFIRALQLPAWIAGCAGAPLLTELRR